MPRVLDCRDPSARADAVAAAVRAARNGRLVALPAESGYVLVADAFSAAGVSLLQQAKQLPATTSLGVLVGNASGAHGIAAGIAGPAQDLMAAFWPGQLGLVLRTQPSLSWTVPTDRCVVRMPLHPLLLEVVMAVGPMVASAGNEDHERERAAIVLDVGVRAVGIGSTLVDATSSPPVLLKAGAVPTDRISEVVPGVVVAP